MNSGRARVRLVEAGTVLVAAALIAGCGNSYRPVVTPVNPSGPAAQPSAYAAVVSAPSPSSPGFVTFIDYSGDTVMTVAPIGPGPRTFVVDGFGFYGLHRQQRWHPVQLRDYDLPASQGCRITPRCLPPRTSSTSRRPSRVSGPPISMAMSPMCSPDLPQTFKLAIPVALTPVTIIGGFQRFRTAPVRHQPELHRPHRCGLQYFANHRTNRSGHAHRTCHLYRRRAHCARQMPRLRRANSDQRRLFVMNRGDDTVSVINTQNNTLDQCSPYLNQNGQTVTCHPILPLSTDRCHGHSASRRPMEPPAWEPRPVRSMPNTTPQPTNSSWQITTAEQSASSTSAWMNTATIARPSEPPTRFPWATIPPA